MTDEQFKKYQKISNELQPIKNFLCWCGNRYKEMLYGKRTFKIVSAIKKFGLRMDSHLGSISDNTYEIPYDLQKRIVDVIEDYVDEKQKELDEI